MNTVLWVLLSIGVLKMKNYNNNRKAKAILEYFDMDYEVRIKIAELINIGGASGIQTLIDDDVIYFSGTHLVSLVDKYDGFNLTDHYLKISNIVDKKGKLKISNLFYETGSNRRGYDLVEMLRNNGYLVTVNVINLKVTAIVYVNKSSPLDVIKTKYLSITIREEYINRKVFSILDDIGRNIKKSSKTPTFETFYKNIDLYKNDGEISNLVIKHLTDLGYAVKKGHRQSIFFGVNYGIFISWL